MPYYLEKLKKTILDLPKKGNRPITLVPEAIEYVAWRAAYWLEAKNLTWSDIDKLVSEGKIKVGDVVDDENRIY